MQEARASPPSQADQTGWVGPRDGPTTPAGAGVGPLQGNPGLVRPSDRKRTDQCGVCQKA